MTEKQVYEFLQPYLEKWFSENVYEQVTISMLVNLEDTVNELLKISDAGYNAVVDFYSLSGTITVKLHKTERPMFIVSITMSIK